jgi:hypothetical protein
MKTRKAAHFHSRLPRWLRRANSLFMFATFVRELHDWIQIGRRRCCLCGRRLYWGALPTCFGGWVCDECEEQISRPSIRARLRELERAFHDRSRPWPLLSEYEKRKKNRRRRRAKV